MAASQKTNLYAFFGTDEGRVKEAALALTEKLVPAGDEFGLEAISGQADNSDHASQIVSQTLEALQTLPFFGGEKVVWLQAANFFGDSQTGRAEATLSAVERLIEVIEAGVPPDVTFVLSASEIDKRRSFFKKFSKLAEVETLDKADISREGWETQVMGQVSAKARELGLNFDPSALERFVLTAGADTRQWQSELEKLALYLGDRNDVNSDDVRAVVASTHAGVIWEIGDAIALRDLPRALQLIDQQLHRGENAIGLLLAGIVPRIRNLLQARDLVESHGLQPGRNFKAFEAEVNRLPAGEIAHLPRKKDGSPSCYPLFLAARACGQFTTGELKDALNHCLEANLRLISTQLDPHMVLSQLVTRILAGRKNRWAA